MSRQELINEPRMPTTCRAFLFVCLAFAAGLVACTSERARTEALLAETDIEQLRGDAAMIYKELFASSGAGFTTLPSSRWPRSFQKLQPLRIGAYRDGFTLVKETRADSEEGIYLIPLHMDYAPAPGPRAKFQRLGDGVYWYSFGN